MTPYMLLIALTLVAALAVVSRAHAADPSKGAVIAGLITQTRTCQTQIGVPRSKSGNPWAPHSTAYRQWQRNLWTRRLNACRASLHERARQWNWQAWMPAHWQRLAQCEESMDWHHYGGGYEGAFAFAYSSWDAFRYPGYPDSAANASPWQQWQVARRIAAHYHSIAGSWGCWRGPQHAWVRGGLSEYGTWQ